jgi:hypothetical protein
MLKNQKKAGKKLQSDISEIGREDLPGKIKGDTSD